jgi:hypothetical protein
MSQATTLHDAELGIVVSNLGQVLDFHKMKYVIMDGAAMCLITGDLKRRVIQVNQRNITVDQLIFFLLQAHLSFFTSINLFGHIVLGYKLVVPGATNRAVSLEVFEQQSWPQRPQYNLDNALLEQVIVDESAVKPFSNEWLIRQNLLCYRSINVTEPS